MRYITALEAWRVDGNSLLTDGKRFSLSIIGLLQRFSKLEWEEWKPWKIGVKRLWTLNVEHWSVVINNDYDNL